MTPEPTPEPTTRKRPTAKQLVGWLISAANAVWHWLQRKATAAAATALVASVAALALATIAVTGGEPSNKALDDLAAQVSQIQGSADVDPATADLATAIVDIKARLDENVEAVATETDTRATADAATTARVDELDARIVELAGAVDALTARVRQANADLATASAILTAGVYDVAAKIDGTNAAQSSALADLAARIDALAAIVGRPVAPTAVASSATVTADANGRAPTTFTVADWVPSSAAFPSVNFVDDNGLWTVTTTANRTVLVSMIRRTIG